MKIDLTRRSFLRTSVGIAAVAVPGAGILLGCEGRRTPIHTADAGGAPAGYPAGPASAPVPIAAPPVTAISCGATETNIEGPYYRVGAPMRSNLRDPAMQGVSLVLSGRVMSLDCRSALADAVLDLWQADASGHYDNDGSSGPGAPLRLRGKVTTDARGAFRVETIIPGRYLNGARYRPAHLHVKVTAPGHAALTTQLYFPDDPFNDADPFLRPSLIMDVAPSALGADARYDFVLVPTS